MTWIETLTSLGETESPLKFVSLREFPRLCSSSKIYQRSVTYFGHQQCANPHPNCLNLITFLEPFFLNIQMSTYHQNPLRSTINSQLHSKDNQTTATLTTLTLFTPIKPLIWYARICRPKLQNS